MNTLYIVVGIVIWLLIGYCVARWSHTKVEPIISWGWVVFLILVWPISILANIVILIDRNEGCLERGINKFLGSGFKISK